MLCLGRFILIESVHDSLSCVLSISTSKQLKQFDIEVNLGSLYHINIFYCDSLAPKALVKLQRTSNSKFMIEILKFGITVTDFYYY